MPAIWKHKLIQADIGAEATRIMTKRGWLPSELYQQAESISDYSRGEVRHRGPGHPIFSVTARDLAIIFYRLGVTTLTALNRQLYQRTYVLTSSAHGSHVNDVSRSASAFSFFQAMQTASTMSS